MALRCAKCGMQVQRINLEYHKENCRGNEMGHAFKLMLMIEGPNKYTSHEILHYVDQGAAEDAFDALAEFPQDGFKVSVLKLYEPPKRYTRG